jgi:DNA-binding Lrp family transcriptional regulator
MSKPEVAMALERLVSDLEDRGARPLVVYLPDAADGSKQGVDDWLARGGTVEQLEEIARPFDSADAARERMDRDAPLRDRLAALWRMWRDEPHRGIGGHTRREIRRAMLEDAARKGEPVRGGVRVVAAVRPLAERAGVSTKAVVNALRALERDGIIRRDRRAARGRAADAPAYYVLLTPTPATAKPGRARGTHDGKTEGRRDGQRGAQTERRAERESDPGVYPMRAPRAHPANPLNAREFGEIKRLRWSYVAREYAPDEHGYVYHYIRRLDKTAGRLLEALIEAHGEATVADLAAAVHARRVRDLVRDDRALRVRPVKTLADRTIVDYARAGRVGAIVRLVDAGIVALCADRVTLTDDWREKLGIARELGGEYETERRTRERHARARRAFKARKAHKADRAPTEAAMDADPRRAHRRKVRRVVVLVGHGMRYDIAAREVFGADGFISDLERGDPPEPERRLPPKRNGVYVHGPECDCWICGAGEPGEAGAA